MRDGGLHHKRSPRPAGTHSGQAALIAIIFFLAISVVAIFGFSRIALRETRNARTNFEAKQSYTLAEAGIEDLFYRIGNSKQYTAAGEVIQLGDVTVTTAVTDVGVGGKEILATGDAGGALRRVKTVLRPGVGASMSYGAQAGLLGFTFRRFPTVFGSIFSNSTVRRLDNAGRATLTGSLVAAKAAEIPDELRNLETLVAPANPPDELTYINTAAHRVAAQSVVPTVTGAPTQLRFYMKKVGGPGNIPVWIVKDNNGVPATGGGSVVVQMTLNNPLVSTQWSWVTLTPTLQNDMVLFRDEKYWIVFNNGTFNASNYYVFGAADATSNPGEFLYTQSFNAGPWTQPEDPPGPSDMAFILFVGDENPYIDHMDVEGEAWAHMIQYSTIDQVGGVAYPAHFVVDGGGNTFNGGTQSPEAPPEPLPDPITDEGIDYLVSVGDTEGNTYNGDLIIDGPYTLGGSGQYSHITGNLRLINNADVTLRGHVHVDGNVTLQNLCKMKLDPGSFQNGSGAIVAEGTIDAGNNCVFSGSGAGYPNSFIFFISRAQELFSPSAVRLHNSVIGGVFYAEEGQLFIEETPKPVATFGQGVYAEDTTEIHYDIGLASSVFSGGPTGGLAVELWQETE